MPDLVIYKKLALTGGGATALDGIDGADLVGNELAFVTVSNILYHYLLNATSGATEASPMVIAPDVNPGNKRWILQHEQTVGPLVNLLTNTQWIANSGSTAENVTGTALHPTATCTDPDNDQDVTTGWSVENGTIDSVAGGHTGNCLELTRSSSSKQGIYWIPARTVGKLYKLSFWVKSGTSGDEAFSIWVNSAYVQSGTSSGAWVNYTYTFEHVGDTFGLYKESATAGTMLFDDITLYEITPGYVAADTLAPDGGTKTSTLDIHRTHQDTTHTKGFYGLKYTKGAVTAEYHNIKTITGAELEQYKGLPVAFGFGGYSVTATDNLKIQIYDGVGTTESAFWAADTLAWKEITRTVDASATELTFRVLLDGDTSDVAYGSFYMAVEGTSIGEWNYAPIPGEEIFCQSNITLTGYTATTSAADGIINLEATSSGMIGKGVKAVLVKAYGKDSAAGDGVGFDVQSASGVEDGISVDTQVNNIRVQGQGWVKTDANGDIYFDHRGSGASALTIDIRVIGIRT